MFEDELAKALCSLREAAGKRVTYWRGENYVRVTAVKGFTTFQLADDQGGAIVEAKTSDFIVGAAELNLNGVRITPQRGDLVKETTCGAEYVYEVARPGGGGEQPWTYSDPARSTVRIHTRLKGTTNVGG